LPDQLASLDGDTSIGRPGHRAGHRLLGMHLP
jgi:hypothetical protein